MQPAKITPSKVTCKQPALAFDISADILCLTFTRAGEGLSWLGPAMRGVVAKTLKDATCRWPEPLRSAEWRYCKNCEHIHECEYGVTFESSQIPNIWFKDGTQDGLRSITMAPAYPSNQSIKAGDQVGVRLLLLGANAIDVRDAVIHNIQIAGASNLLGPNRLGFRVTSAAPQQSRSVSMSELIQPQVDRPEVIPAVKIQLNTPMFLKQSESRSTTRRKQANLSPTFSELFANCMRIVSRSFSVYTPGELEQSVNFRNLKDLAGTVEPREHNWVRFDQNKYSNRQRKGFSMVGVTGSAVFQNVPRELVPWLELGGQLGIGSHRVAGAGIFTAALAY
jgi:hypothetical protein